MFPLRVQIKMLGHLPVKHFLPLVRVNVGTAFGGMPARKITRLKINTCNTTVLQWLQLARNAFLIYLPSLPLAWVWEWIDLIKHKPCWELAEGVSLGQGMGWLWRVCPALQCFSTRLFPLFAPLGAFSSKPRITLGLCASSLWNGKDGIETEWEDYCCLWQLMLMVCACLHLHPPIPTCVGHFFFFSFVKRGVDYWKLAFSLHKYRTSWFSAGDY